MLGWQKVLKINSGAQLPAGFQDGEILAGRSRQIGLLSLIVEYISIKNMLKKIKN